MIRVIRQSFPILEKVWPSMAYRWAFDKFFTPLRFPQPEREIPTIQKAESFTMPVSGKKTVFYSWGNTQNPTLLLVHGWMGRGGQFYKFVDPLLDRGFHVVTFDGPAHGLSEGKKTHLNEFAESILGLEHRYGPIEKAVGHSFGGIAIIYSIVKGSHIKDITLISTPTIGSEIIKEFLKQINGTDKTRIAFQQFVKQRFGFDFNELSASSLVQKVAFRSLLLVHDYEDRDVNISHAREILRQIPKAKTHFTTGLGHTRILRNDEVIENVIQFFKAFE